MRESLLVELFGFPATLIHGDPLVLDRWLWLRHRLPRTAAGETLLDIGCGSGAFTIGAALRGYRSVGLTWDDRERAIATERARITKASASFETFDIRALDRYVATTQRQFDFAICFENIEHVLDDFKLMRDIYAALKPGGVLYLSTPNLHYRPISKHDAGPCSVVEDGGHVRRGYTAQMLTELCDAAGFYVESFSSCSGVLSQRLCSAQRAIGGRNRWLGWASILPLRPLPPLLDRLITHAIDYPRYSICMEAYKPRSDARQSTSSTKGPVRTRPHSPYSDA